MDLGLHSSNVSGGVFSLGICYKTAKKKKGMNVGFVNFENAEHIINAVEVLKERPSNGKQIKVADAVRRSEEKKKNIEIAISHSNMEHGPSIASSNPTEDTCAFIPSIVESVAAKAKTVRDVVTPLAHMSYGDQLEHKKNSLLQMLKRLTRNARKACPNAVTLPNWILKSREIGLPCKLEGILKSPLVDGYRNKCEFSVGLSVDGRRTVGFMLGNFRDGMIAVEEPSGCPNVSRISCKYAMVFQDFLQSSELPVWNRIENTGFWRQFTVREGRSPSHVATDGNEGIEIAEVMLIVQVSSLGYESCMRSEFDRMVHVLVHGAAACSPPLPLTAIVVQDHVGISNAAPADCPLITLEIPKVEGGFGLEMTVTTETRIHDYISNLRFSISPTAFFQVNTLAAARLYSLAGDWAELSPDTILFDICCGTGTIGLTLAHRVGLVVGIEMNESAVSDANRNAEINGIKNCRFICGKAEDVMGSILKEYLEEPKHHGEVSGDPGNNVACSVENGSNNAISAGCLADHASAVDVSADNPKNKKEMLHCLDDEKMNKSANPTDQRKEEENPGHSSVAADISVEIKENCSSEKTNANDLNRIHIDNNDNSHNNACKQNTEIGTDTVHQFKKVVAIVDPPRVGLHPIVIKVLRSNPRIRRLVYISCNPESLVANAIELCTPTADKPEKAKGNRNWRNMSNAGLARHRLKSMPSSEPFQPVRAMAVDLFPHTPHCEMVMLMERL
ncbi:hypothetical protein HPP92_012277 [Vanilla planifolia]|uniref:Methyltransferase domain-containing protein n=1 Tax=Vanilla planifolia TaxID=51239 RepID=A0A835R039_VANPL|nr:hypothetical protein HPP92_012277 [Vanilla planifolia]